MTLITFLLTSAPWAAMLAPMWIFFPQRCLVVKKPLPFSKEGQLQYQRLKYTVWRKLGLQNFRERSLQKKVSKVRMRRCLSGYVNFVLLFLFLQVGTPWCLSTLWHWKESISFGVFLEDASPFSHSTNFRVSQHHRTRPFPSFNCQIDVKVLCHSFVDNGITKTNSP